MAYLGVVASGVLQASNTVQNLTVATAVPAGGTGVGAICWDSSDNTVPVISSIVDNRGNVYVADDQVAGGTTIALLQFRGKISNALEVGDTITITTTTQRIRWATKILGFDDVLQAMALSAMDAHDNNPTTNSTSMLSGTVTTSQDKILLVTSHGLGIGRTFTAPGGWTETTSVETAAGSADRAVKMLFKYATVAGTYSETTTISPTGTNGGIICAYKVVPNRKNYSQVQHRYEGLANNTQLTTANTGDAAGVAYNQVNGTALVSSSEYYKGSRGVVNSVSSGTTAGGRDTTNIGGSRVVRGRCYFKTSANPGSNLGVAQALNGSSMAARIQLTTGGVIRIIDSTSTQMVTSGATTLPLSAWCRIEWRFVASTTVGQASVKVWFNPASTGTPDIDLSSAASFNTLAYFDGYDAGISFTASQTYSAMWDEVAWSIDDAAEIGPQTDDYTITYDFEGAGPLDTVESTSNASIDAGAAKTGSAGLRLNSQTTPACLRATSLTFGSGRRYASLAAWVRQPSGNLTQNASLVRFRNTNPNTDETGGNGDLWIDRTTGFIRADLYGPKAMTGTGNVTTATNTSATSLTANKPANVTDGDLLWAVFFHATNSGTITPPAGWTIHKTEGGNGTFCFATKPIPSASAESATTYAFSTNQAAARCTLQVGRIVGADLSSTIDVVGTSSGFAGTTSVVMPAITTTQANDGLFGVAINRTTNSTPAVFTAPTGMTEVSQLSIVSGATTSSAQLSQQFLSASGSTGTRTATISPAAANSGGFLVSIKRSALTGAVNLASNWFYLQAVCAFKDNGESMLKLQIDGVEIGTIYSALPNLGEALAGIIIGSQVVLDSIVDYDSFELMVSDNSLGYIGSASTPGPQVRSGGLWTPAAAYVRDAGAWVPADVYVRDGGSWVIAG